MATPESCDDKDHDKDLECPVCMEPYALVGDHQPRVLACSGAHELCEQCIAALPRVSSKLVCPQCREHVATSNPNRGLIAALRMHAGSRAREATAAGAAVVAEAAAAASERQAAQAERKLSRKVAEHGRNAAARAAATERKAAERQAAAQREAAARRAAAARRNRLDINLPLLPVVAMLAVAFAAACWTWWPAARPVDADLEPRLLWADAIAALDDNRHEDAAWLMLITVFLDWSYNDGTNLPAISKALAGCGQCGVWASALRPLITYPSGATNPVHANPKRFAATYDTLASALVSGPAWHEHAATLALSSAPLGSSDDRLTFACACVATFYARDLFKLFEERSFDGIGSRVLRIGRNALAHVSLAATHLQPERYLALMFELAYSNRNMNMVAEGTKWSQRFQAAAPQWPNSHWKYFLESDRDGEKMAQKAKTTIQSGMSYKHKAQFVADEWQAYKKENPSEKMPPLPEGLRRMTEAA